LSKISVKIAPIVAYLTKISENRQKCQKIAKNVKKLLKMPKIDVNLHQPGAVAYNQPL